MDILNNSIVTDADTEVLDSQITQISNDFSETYYFDSEQEEELELLVAKAMKLGELYERKKWQAAKAQSEKALLEQFEINNKLVEQIEELKAKAQAIPDGFAVVPKEPTPKMIDATWNYDDEIQDMSHNTRNKFIYKAMIEAQEQAND